MTPFWHDDHLTLYGGDCRDVLRELPAESVHCVVTSPPYFGLRDYGVPGQIGLEASHDEFVASMVGVFREVRRVMRPDATLWLNLGDHFADKQLAGSPWRVAFALQADGWYLRSDIIWSKPNPMPESVTDRPTKAHEYLFLLTKSPRYYYDADAVREAGEGYGRSTWEKPQFKNGDITRHHGNGDGHGSNGHTYEGGRNLRSVWTIATEPYPGAHFATFPRKLVEPCVKAGTSERGVCPECGAPWVRLTEVEYVKGKRTGHMGYHAYENATARFDASSKPALDKHVTTTGWRASCAHDAEPIPATCLDPFAGSGTTLLVAQALGRRGIGIDLSPDYLKQALARNAQTPLGLVG